MCLYLFLSSEELMQKVASLHALGAISMEMVLKKFPQPSSTLSKCFQYLLLGVLHICNPLTKQLFNCPFSQVFQNFLGNLSDCVWLGNIEDIMDTFARGWLYLYNFIYIYVEL